MRGHFSECLHALSTSGEFVEGELVWPSPTCGFHSFTADGARRLLCGRHLAFVGNSVQRRTMYALADVLGGPNATRISAAPRTSAIFDELKGYHGFQHVRVRCADGRASAPVQAEDYCGVAPAEFEHGTVRWGSANVQNEWLLGSSLDNWGFMLTLANATTAEAVALLQLAPRAMLHGVRGAVRRRGMLLVQSQIHRTVAAHHEQHASGERGSTLRLSLVPRLCSDDACRPSRFAAWLHKLHEVLGAIGFASVRVDARCLAGCRRGPLSCPVDRREPTLSSDEVRRKSGHMRSCMRVHACAFPCPPPLMLTYTPFTSIPLHILTHSAPHVPPQIGLSFFFHESGLGADVLSLVRAWGTQPAHVGASADIVLLAPATPSTSWAKGLADAVADRHRFATGGGGGGGGGGGDGSRMRQGEPAAPAAPAPLFVVREYTHVDRRLWNHAPYSLSDGRAALSSLEAAGMLPVAAFSPTARAWAAGHIGHPDSRGIHFDDRGRTLVAQLVLNAISLHSRLLSVGKGAGARGGGRRGRQTGGTRVGNGDGGDGGRDAGDEGGASDGVRRLRRRHRRTSLSLLRRARWPNATTVPRVGYCGVTADEGDCARSDKGSWALGKYQIRHLVECVARCRGCARCRYVSYSPAHDECAWYHSCRMPLETAYQGDTYQTLRVERTNAVQPAMAAFRLAVRSRQQVMTAVGSVPAGRRLGLRPQDVAAGDRAEGGWRVGYCEEVAANVGDCTSSTFGNWQIPQRAAGSRESAKAFCVGRCAECARCAYVSVSSEWHDCSWFAHCDLSRLKTGVRGFESIAISASDATAMLSASGGHRAGANATACPAEFRLAERTVARAALFDPALGEWLRSSRVGSCSGPLAVLSDGLGDCVHGDGGVFALSEAETAEWPRAARACLQHCTGCRRCAYVSVSRRDGFCAWHTTCNANAVWSAEHADCAMRWSAVPPSVRSSRRAALIHFGKHAASAGVRSSRQLAADNASLPLLRHSASHWLRHLIRANPGVRFDVLAHSWSPEVAEELEALWGPLLRRAVHEPARYASADSTQLAWRCATVQANCARTISQLLSVSKAVALKREAELLDGRSYDLVLVARPDLAFISDWVLHDGLLASAAAGEQAVWLPLDCESGQCVASGGPGAPSGCILRGRLCPLDYAKGRGREWFIGKDWLFGGSSRAADVMGDAIDFFQSHSAFLARRWDFSATHFLWPFHAQHAGLSLRWGLLPAELVYLARERFRSKGGREADDGENATCYYQTSLRPAKRIDPVSLHHANVLNYQCPYAQALACPCATGLLHGLIPIPRFNESVVTSHIEQDQEASVGGEAV